MLTLLLQFCARWATPDRGRGWTLGSPRPEPGVVATGPPSTAVQQGHPPAWQDAYQRARGHLQTTAKGEGLEWLGLPSGMGTDQGRKRGAQGPGQPRGPGRLTLRLSLHVFIDKVPQQCLLPPSRRISSSPFTSPVLSSPHFSLPCVPCSSDTHGLPSPHDPFVPS